MPRKIYATEEERVAGKKATQRRYYLKNKDKILAFTKQWAIKNKQRCRDNLNKWRAENKEQYKATEAAWIEKNKARVIATQKRSYDKHKEKRRATHRQWMRDNRDVVNSYSGKRRIGKKYHPAASASAIREIYRLSSRMTKESGQSHHTDHIIPVRYGGPHHEDNLQPLTDSMNASKNANPFWLSPHMAIKDWRDVPRNLWPIDLVPKYLALIEKHKGESIRWDTAA